MDNAAKNTYVKKEITKAMLALLKEKEFKDISVSEITATAQVSRNSFYRNYTDRKAILREHILNLFGEWTADYDKGQTYSDDHLMACMFRHLSERREFYLLLSDRKLLYLLKDVLNGMIGPKPEYSNLGAYTAAFMYSGIFGWIEEWFARGMQESAEQMAALLQNRG